MLLKFGWLENATGVRLHLRARTGK